MSPLVFHAATASGLRMCTRAPAGARWVGRRTSRPKEDRPATPRTSASEASAFVAVFVKLMLPVIDLKRNPPPSFWAQISR